MLRLKAKIRAARGTPSPRFSERGAYHPPKPHVPMADRMNFQGDINSRLGVRVLEVTRECHNCRDVGHIAKYCPRKRNGGGNGGASGGARSGNGGGQNNGGS